MYFVLALITLLAQGCQSQPKPASGPSAAQLQQAQNRLNDPNTSPEERSALLLYLKSHSGQAQH